MNAELIDTSGIDFAKLDKTFLDATGRMKLLPHSAYAQFSPLEIRAWANHRGRYGLPTAELIQWVKEKTGGRKALEIGAGNGDFGFHLGIPMTDSYQQVNDPATVVYFGMLGVQPTRPPKDVEKEDAETAVRRRKPQVVVASWVTQKYLAPIVCKYDGDGLAVSPNGNMFGPREEYILERCETYIFIGNENIHGDKRIMDIPHETFSFPWLVSRAKQPELNRIYVWNRKKT